MTRQSHGAQGSLKTSHVPLAEACCARGPPGASVSPAPQEGGCARLDWAGVRRRVSGHQPYMSRLAYPPGWFTPAWQAATPAHQAGVHQDGGQVSLLAKLV
ncbi:hypothetical protein PCASD_26593 [Puccinia coronata f. sp. avenae]|uniref:Uncharacterized protein n=1 Tax=Puccinia coronata f. sp. avenae TaxID=200324 RepID=A0A2N5TN66_9BASI|nr:hypothetical protein PCASD_26593 [Puccinia coronata f. sp. avenae]